MNPEYLTISEVNTFIKDVINSGFPQPIWICGEIQQYNRNKGKRHIFFELVEKDKKTKDVIARIGLVIFLNKKTYIENILKRSENAFELKDDIEVKFACKVDFYAPHGAMRLIVESIDPTYTLGKIAQERQKLIVELKKEGVLDENKKLCLHDVPLRIGLITSDDSAAYNDFISELNKSKFGFKIFLRNTLMQGNNSAKDVCLAMDELAELDCLDTIVITRGGGSISDLSCFDSRVIAEKIAKYSIPVLTGIGHEINVTITDMAAYTFSKTPTAIAQFLVKRVDDALNSLNDKVDIVLNIVKDKILNSKQDLRNVALFLQNNTIQFLKEHNDDIVKLEQSIKMRCDVLLDSKVKKLFESESMIRKSSLLRLNNEQRRLEHCSKIIDIVDPKKIMSRGFSIVRDEEGVVIKSSKQINNDEKIITEFVDGFVESKTFNVK